MYKSDFEQEINNIIKNNDDSLIKKEKADFLDDMKIENLSLDKVYTREQLINDSTLKFVFGSTNKGYDFYRGIIITNLSMRLGGNGKWANKTIDEKFCFKIVD